MVAALGVQAVHDGSRALPVPRRRDCPSHAGTGVAAAYMTADLDGGWAPLRTVPVPLPLAAPRAPGQLRRHADPAAARHRPASCQAPTPFHPPCPATSHSAPTQP